MDRMSVMKENAYYLTKRVEDILVELDRLNIGRAKAMLTDFRPRMLDTFKGLIEEVEGKCLDQ